MKLASREVNFILTFKYVIVKKTVKLTSVKVYCAKDKTVTVHSQFSTSDGIGWRTGKQTQKELPYTERYMTVLYKTAILISLKTSSPKSHSPGTGAHRQSLSPNPRRWECNPSSPHY